jgi:hypothetical protein
MQSVDSKKKQQDSVELMIKQECLRMLLQEHHQQVSNLLKSIFEVSVKIKQLQEING